MTMINSVEKKPMKLGSEFEQAKGENGGVGLTMKMMNKCRWGEVGDEALMSVPD
jgi:hypothetical protein